MKKHFLWIAEAFVWLLLTVLLIMGMFLCHNLMLKQKHSFHVFFKDTNGIRNGSPVKIMGNEIGYVSNVKVINNNEIFISFVVTNSDIMLPTGTRAKIESTGIVGSRSLELYPPTKSDEPTKDLLVPLNPERVQGAFTNSSRVSKIILASAEGANSAIAENQIPKIRQMISDKAEEVEDISPMLNKISDKEEGVVFQLKNDTKRKKFFKKAGEFLK